MKKNLIKILNIYHFFIAYFANIFYGYPSKKIFVVGVTGTKGKSSTVELIAHTLRFAGFKVASLSSIYETIGNNQKLNTTGYTMPGKGYIFKFLKAAVKNKCQVAVIEVTSLGITQFRDKFISWDAGIFMGLHPEHIEAHGSFEKYRAAKIKFFKHILRSSKKQKYFFINQEDKNYTYFFNAVDGKRNTEIFLFSKNNFLKEMEENGWNLQDFESRELIAPWLVPDFNLINAAATCSFAKIFKISSDFIKGAFKSFDGVPGRFEFVFQKPLVVVDYAHTPDSLKFLYETLEKFYKKPNGKMIAVLGSAGGGRDKWKRPVMGQIAAQFCNEVILTTEDLYDENPKDIILEIKKGIENYLKENNKEIKVLEIEDRKEALRQAILDADFDDIIAASGKGSEKSIHFKNNTTIPWDEKEVILGLFKELQNKI